MKYLKNISLLFLIVLFSCDLGKDPGIGGTKVQAMAGEWWINVLIDGTDLGIGYNLIRTSNTASDNGVDLLLDDDELWPAKIITQVDIKTLTFTPVTNLDNFYSNTIKVSVIEGKVLKGAATTPGLNKTDSIYIKLEFSDDPGTQYEYAGYRRTGFQEDEH